MESSRKQILLLESDPVVLAIINYLLTRQGYAVRAETSATAAAALLRSKPFDAAVVAWDLTGHEWLRAIFSAVPSLRHSVIVVGAGSDLQGHVTLDKPVDFSLLLRAVQRVFAEQD